MEVVSMLKVMWRWMWLIVLIVATTCALLYWTAKSTIVRYSSEVGMVVTTPDREDVAAMDDYVFTSDRDEITIVINKFVEIAEYPIIRTRTLQELNTVEEYDLRVETELGADFITLIVSASSPELAAAIANAHAANTIEYFGEIRALPAAQAQGFFEAEIALAEESLREAETALNDFKIQNNIVSFNQELELQYSVLEQLEISRAQLGVAVATGGQGRSMETSTGEVDPIAAPPVDAASVDALIDAQRQIVNRFVALEPQYVGLEAAVERAREHYTSLLSLNQDVEMRGAFSSEAMFLQVIQPAIVPTMPEDNTIRKIILGGIGSLGLAILLAFFLDYVFNRW
jgi:uncharacterized protein involved in exopolysaccharide biosynthesis